MFTILIFLTLQIVQKFIKVQIQEGNVQDVPGAGSPSRRRDIFALQSASPTVHVAKPLSASPLTKMVIKNKSVLFPETRAGESSGNNTCIVNGTSAVSYARSFCSLYCMFENLNALTWFLFSCSVIGQFPSLDLC